MMGYSKNIICPHCNYVYDIDKNESYHLYGTDDIEELTCGECEKQFFVKVNVSYSFETDIDEDNL